MEHYNFSRQLVKDAMAFLGKYDSPPKKIEGDFTFYAYRQAAAMALDSQKFMLPEDGIIMDDINLRAIDETKIINLPFKTIALEYRVKDSEEEARRGMFLRKRVVFATEKENCIRVVIAAHIDIYDKWYAFYAFEIPRIDFLDRSQPSPNGRPAFKIDLIDTSVPTDIYSHAGHVLLQFLNVLQCSNVKFETSHAKRGAKVKKGAFPFDSYKIITIETHGKKSNGIAPGMPGSVRTMREHLRRGHIRVLQSGLKVWVNAAVVNAGIGGKITNDYRVK